MESKIFFLLSFPTRVKILRVMVVNEINSIAIIYNHPIYLFTSYVIKINK